MQAPNCEEIEIAADTFGQVDELVRISQVKELETAGEHLAKDLGASGLSKDFKIGYELGLQAARVTLAGNAQLVMRGIDSKTLL